MKHTQVDDPRFKLLCDFGIKIPSWYAHHRQIRDFKSKFGPEGVEDVRDKVYRIEEGFTDGSLAHSSFRFTPGRQCLVAIFAVTQKVASDEALGFIQSLEGDLVGGQGVTLLWPQARLNLPFTRRVVSLDLHEKLPAVDIVRRWNGPYRTDEKIGLPYIFRYSGDDVGFHFDPYEEGLNEKHCIAYFKQE